MTHKLASNENFDITRGNQTVRVPFDTTDPGSAETNTLVRMKDLPDADIHFPIVAATTVASTWWKLSDCAVNIVHASSLGTLTLEYPARAQGKSRRFLLRITIDNAATFQFVPPNGTGETTSNDSGSSVPIGQQPSGTYLFSFRELEYDEVASRSTFHIENLTSPKQDKLTFDTAPAAGSTNPVTSGGIATALAGKLDAGVEDNTAYWFYNGTDGLAVFILPGDPDESPQQYLFARGTSTDGSTVARLSDIPDTSDKLDSTSAAPAFDETATYDVGNYVTHDGALYRCTTAVTTAGAWNAANWTAEDMTTPDATLDVTSEGRLRLVDTDGTALWQQGYDLAAESSVTLSCDKINFFAFAATTVPAFDNTATYAVDDRVTYNGKIYKCTTAVETAGAWTGTANWTEDPDTQAFSLPTAPSGKVGDFVLDIDNSANTVAATASLTGLDTTFSIVVPKGENLSQMLTFAAGEMAELYFTQTAFKVNNLTTWKIVKQVVENGGAQA